MLFTIDENNIEQSFIRTAEILLLEKALQVNDALFRFTEIEFYFNAPSHEDTYTHRHFMEAGRWRFHNQGFDITLKGKQGHGGILIRGVKCVGQQMNQPDRYINGPRRVLFEISSHFNLVENVSNKFGVIDAEPLAKDIIRTFRHGLGAAQKNSASEIYVDKDYRFITDHQHFDRKQFSGLEKIARRFDDPLKAERFLNYRLNK